MFKKIFAVIFLLFNTAVMFGHGLTETKAVSDKGIAIASALGAAFAPAVLTLIAILIFSIFPKFRNSYSRWYITFFVNLILSFSLRAYV